MTNEQAISIMIIQRPRKGTKEKLEAYDMAIESLKQESCEDCISRQAATKAICEDGTWLESQGCTEITMVERKQRDADILGDLPPVTPRPKVGYWIEDAQTYYEELNKRGLGVDEYTPYFVDDIACSECLAKYSVLDNETQFFKYCPNCGAKMEVEE